MTLSAFLKTLWGEQPPGWVLVWTLPDKHSTWFKDFSHVDRFVSAHSNKDIYTGVSLKNGLQAPKGYERCTNRTSAGIAGLWADIDIAGEGHQKQDLPKSQNEALEILGGIEYEPSIIVNSGHGLQCWWLFVRPWIFQDEHEKNLARQLTFNWNYLLQGEFNKHGYTLDATHDLARVMRLPGTLNHKLNSTKRVEVIQTSDFRWRDIPTLPQHTSSLDTPAALSTQQAPAEVGELNISADQPLPRICEFMLENMAKFQLTWVGRRSDLASSSEFDMSIAGNGVAAGCSDQEIAAMIIHFHKQRGDDLFKYCERPDYIKRTISRARGVEYHA